MPGCRFPARPGRSCRLPSPNQQHMPRHKDHVSQTCKDAAGYQACSCMSMNQPPKDFTLSGHDMLCRDMIPEGSSPSLASAVFVARHTKTVCPRVGSGRHCEIDTSRSNPFHGSPAAQCRAGNARGRGIAWPVPTWKVDLPTESHCFEFELQLPSASNPPQRISLFNLGEQFEMRTPHGVLALRTRGTGAANGGVALESCSGSLEFSDRGGICFLERNCGRSVVSIPAWAVIANLSWQGILAAPLSCK
jgi:hypothetical protein